VADTSIKRCAIYARKSSEEGLEQDFNSLHAQREACEAFIKSQGARAGDWSKPLTTTAVSRAGRWSARLCSSS
jgi:DNA invertase Pin-like site-specific DNA recombinase